MDRVRLLVWVLFLILNAELQGFGQGVTPNGSQTSTQKEESIYIGLDPTMQQRSRDIARAREWIWTHWHERRGGKLVVTFLSIEGHKNKSTIAISADSSSSWHALFHIDRYDGGKIQDSSEFDAYSIERLRVPTVGHLDEPPPITADEILKPAEYRLVFRGKEGKVLSEF